MKPHLLTILAVCAALTLAAGCAGKPDEATATQAAASAVADATRTTRDLGNSLEGASRAAETLGPRLDAARSYAERIEAKAVVVETHWGRAR